MKFFLPRKTGVIVALMVGVFAALSSGAHEYTAGSLHIEHPWARATVQGQAAGGAFVAIENKGAADRLLGASSGAAASVELHTMSMDGDVMRMRQVKAIDLPAGARVELKPGALHIMLLGLKAPLAAGSSFPLTLRFEKAGDVKVDVHVEAPKPDAMDHMH